MSRTHFDAKQKIWSGDENALESGPKVSLGRSLLERLLKHPDHVGQISDSSGRQYTNREIATLSIRVAQHLHELGIQQEDVVAFCAMNTDFVAPLVFGALLCGAIVSTLYPMFGKDDFRYMFSLTKPKLLFCDGKLYDTVHDCLTEVNLNIRIYTMRDHREGVRRIDELIASTGKESAYRVQPLKLGSSQTAFVICTSGTTGSIKGVRMSHENFLHSMKLKIESFPHDGRIVCFSDLYWISGVGCLLIGTLNDSTRIITDQAYSVEMFLKMLEQHKVTYAIGEPSIIAKAVKSPEFKTRDLTSLKFFVCVGNTIPQAVLQGFLEGAKHCKFVAMYGMSELNGACCFGVPKQGFDNGQLSPNFSAKIIDESGQRMGVGQRGEVLIKQPFKWPGYYNRPEETKLVYSDDGWMRTDDIGYFDDEGCLFIFGRKKDLLRVKDMTIFPQEIEVVIIQIPDVVEVCVVGIYDALVAAAIVKTSDSFLTEDEVAKHVADRLADSNHITGGVYFVDHLPRTCNGKHIRPRVREALEKLWDQKPKMNGNRDLF